VDRDASSSRSFLSVLFFRPQDIFFFLIVRRDCATFENVSFLIFVIPGSGWISLVLSPLLRRSCPKIWTLSPFPCARAFNPAVELRAFLPCLPACMIFIAPCPSSVPPKCLPKLMPSRCVFPVLRLSGFPHFFFSGRDPSLRSSPLETRARFSCGAGSFVLPTVDALLLCRRNQICRNLLKGFDLLFHSRSSHSLPDFPPGHQQGLCPRLPWISVSCLLHDGPSFFSCD